VSQFTKIDVEPYFYYNVIPTHLQFRTDFGFYFINGFTDGEQDPDKNGVQWKIEPKVFWNFLGTGAGGYGGTGIFFRYRLISGDANSVKKDGGYIVGPNNKFDIQFKLSF